ncbi:MAG: hypothetical protein ACI4V7_00975 [Succinivibrionaceae bacterium]|jgi:hypothetical protein
MFKKKTKIYTEIDEDKLKKLKLFESVDGNFNELGFNVLYTRIPGGIIRTVLNPESIDQLFIPLQNSYFI